MISINPESGNIYTTISDQHDMFGINPLGGKGLVAVTPTQKSNFKTDVKFDVEDNLNKKETLAKMEEAADFIEQKYKVPREKNANAVTYQRRVIGEINPKANMTLLDYQIKDEAPAAPRLSSYRGPKTVFKFELFFYY